MRQWVRKCEALVAGRDLVFPVMACDKIHVEAAWTPSLTAHTTGGLFQLLGAPQPAVPVERGVVGDQHGVEEGTLLDAAPRVGFVPGGPRAPRPVEPVDD